MLYDTSARVENPRPNLNSLPPDDINTNHIWEDHDTSQLQRQLYPEPVAVSGPSFTPINANESGSRDHKQATNLKGVLCPIKNCSRNSRSSPKHFARADNLGSHLRKVHGIKIPPHSRVRHWITGNKGQVFLQAEGKARELHELGILKADGTWE